MSAISSLYSIRHLFEEAKQKKICERCDAKWHTVYLWLFCFIMSVRLLSAWLIHSNRNSNMKLWLFDCNTFLQFLIFICWAADVSECRPYGMWRPTIETTLCVPIRNVSGFARKCHLNTTTDQKRKATIAHLRQVKGKPNIYFMLFDFLPLTHTHTHSWITRIQ